MFQAQPHWQGQQGPQSLQALQGHSLDPFLVPVAPHSVRQQAVPADLHTPDTLALSLTYLAQGLTPLSQGLSLGLSHTLIAVALVGYKGQAQPYLAVLLRWTGSFSVMLGLPYDYACCCGGGGAHAYGTDYAAALAVAAAAVAPVQDLEAVQLVAAAVAAAVVPAVVIAAKSADVVMPQGPVEEHVSHEVPCALLLDGAAGVDAPAAVEACQKATDRLSEALPARLCHRECQGSDHVLAPGCLGCHAVNGVVQEWMCLSQAMAVAPVLLAEASCSEADHPAADAAAAEAAAEAAAAVLRGAAVDAPAWLLLLGLHFPPCTISAACCLAV